MSSSWSHPRLVVFSKQYCRRQWIYISFKLYFVININTTILCMQFYQHFFTLIKSVTGWSSDGVIISLLCTQITTLNMHWFFNMILIVIFIVCNINKSCSEKTKETPLIDINQFIYVYYVHDYSLLIQIWIKKIK